MSNTLVPNRFPAYDTPRRIALIGEAPGKDEVCFGRPFVGASGRFLAALLSRAGVSMDACYLGNISQYQPPNNDFSFFNWSGDEVQHGLYQLTEDMKRFKPNIVVLLGNAALAAAKCPENPRTGKKWRFSNANWRGSLFIGNSGGPFDGLKCLATYHPAYCLRDYDTTPLLQFDLRKAARESTTPLLILPKRNFQVSGSMDEQLEALRRLRREKSPVAIDIEGGIDTMSCVSFASSPTEAFIIPISDKAGNLVIEPPVWRELALTLEDPYVPKVLQNSLYDRFVLHYSYGIRVQGVVDDTMLKHWELYAELEKNLGLQTSIYTDDPYYKGDRKSDDDKTFYEYCCRDSAVTLEIAKVIQSKFYSEVQSGRSATELNNIRGHYQFNIGTLNPILYMELRGIRYDIHKAHERRMELLNRMHECQARFNALTGHGFSFNSVKEICEYAKNKFFTKKGDRPYKEYEGTCLAFSRCIEDRNPTLATIGELEDLCEVSLNVNSTKQFQAYLYETLKLPVQMSQERDPSKRHVTSDYEALLNLSRWCQQNKHDFGYRVCQATIELRALETRSGMLEISADKDGRIRCGYNIVGTNTGRITCYESPTGSGYNLQTIPNYTVIKEAPGGVLGDRDLFLADEGYYLFQCDLAGADGWTVAAYCKMLGDSAMLDDYLAGIKPYAKIALKLAGRPEAEWKDRQALKAFLKEYKLGDLEKLTAKRVQHGGAYLEGGLTISRNVLKDSEGKHYIPPAECDKLKRWYINEQYPGMPRWHDWIARRLAERPVLTAASGQVRQFFGRPDEILTKAVAFEPQANTTYATNLAAWRLWTDNENRLLCGVPSLSQSNESVGNDKQIRLGQTSMATWRLNNGDPCRLRIEPLHQVHDALIGQFRIEDTAWAVGKIKSYFANPLIIAGQTITIPFDGAYGESWGNLNKGKI